MRRFEPSTLLRNIIAVAGGTAAGQVVVFVSVRSVVVGARLPHSEPPPEHVGCGDPLPRHSRSASADRQHWDQGGEGEWQRRKHGGAKRRIRRKIHIAVDAQTLEIRAVEVTSSAIGDAPVLPDLLSQIAPQETIAGVMADGAYDTRAYRDAIAARGAVAIIPPRKDARLWKPTTGGAKARHDALRSSKHLGRALWRKWSGHHRQSRVEAKMNCIQQLGHRLMAKAFDRQVAEVQIRAAILNRFTALGTPKTARVA